MNRSIPCCACLVLLSGISFASAAATPPEVSGSPLSTSPSQKGASTATAESEFPPQNIRPEAIAELIKGAEIVTQAGCSGVHEGKNVGVIINTYHVDLPGFADEQPVEVGFIQGTDNYIYFKGPGFLYEAEGGNLIRKRLVRLSSIESSMLEEGIRHAIRSRTHADEQSLLLVLCIASRQASRHESYLRNLGYFPERFAHFSNLCGRCDNLSAKSCSVDGHFRQITAL
jgi:hypothetical protein